MGLIRLLFSFVLVVQALPQQPGISSEPRSEISVPFVGCKSDGQVGPLDAPQGTSISVAVTSGDAHELAYYKSAQGIGVLGPRGWQCFGTYGSAGSSLFVAPTAIDTKNIFGPGRGKFAGAGIQVSCSLGDTSGRFMVAEIVARVFPAYKQFAAGVMEMFDQPLGSFPFGPYPADRLRYKSKTIVEYQTPAQSDGLGTHAWLEKNDVPINGAAILVGQTSAPDLMFLAVRLPPGQQRHTPAVVSQFEREVARLPVN